MLIAWVLCVNIQAQGRQPLHFNHQLFEHGSEIRRLGVINETTQDEFGFIWLAGTQALGRYDGTTLKIYTHKNDLHNSLPDNYIWDIAINDQGQVWIATGRGICRYIREYDHFDCPQSFAGSKAIANGASSLLFDQEGRLYVGNHASPFRIDFTHNTLEEFQLTPKGSPSSIDNTVWDIQIGPSGNLWFATRNSGIVRYSPLTQTAEVIETPCSSNEQKMMYQSLAFDNANNLWAGTNGGGLCWLNLSSHTFEKMVWPSSALGNSERAVITDIEIDHKGIIWVSVDHQGLLMYDEKKQLLKQHWHSGTQPTSIAANKIRSVFEDKNNDIWVGLFPAGADFLDRSHEHLSLYQHDAGDPTSLSHNSILSVFEDSKNKIWVGTEFGLNRLNSDGSFKRYVANPGNTGSLQANAILSITEDREGFLWIGTWNGGLHRFNTATEKFKHYPVQSNNPHSLGDYFSWSVFYDSLDRLWIGSEGVGLQRYRKDTDDFIHYDNIGRDGNSISNLYVMNIEEDKDGDLWLSTYNGLNRFTPETETFKSWISDKNDPVSLSSSLIKSVLSTREGNLWVGTHDNGLNHFNPSTGKAQRFGFEEGLPSLTVSSLIEDNAGYIWAATTNGLARINPETFQIDVYAEGAGLAGVNYNRDAALAARDGTLYFGSTEGLTVMPPNGLTENSSWHPVHLTEFRVLDKTVALGPNSPLKESILTSDSVTLDYASGMFSLDFAVLSYRFPGKYEYAYQLEGFDNTWLYIGLRNTATYTNLNPGTYQFKVKARIPGEQWKEREKALTIVITPPWWRTYWAYVIYTVLCFGFIYFIYCIGRLKYASDNYKYLATTDNLTGIFNRSGILSIVETLYSQKIDPRDYTLATLIVDIDHFKKINDTHGHATGDKAIRHIVDTLQQNIRKSDHIGRWGGEEFIIVMLLESALPLERFGSDLCAAVAETPINIGGTHLNITISIGGVLHHDHEPFEEACQRADEALYMAKESGRNRFCGA